MASKRMCLPLQIIGAISLISLAFSAPAQRYQAGPGEVYRWADDDGKLHYTRTLPAEYADRPYDVLRDGLVIRRVTDPSNVDGDSEHRPPVMTEEERQEQLDRMLVVKFRSERELEQSLENDLGQLTYDRRLLSSSHDSIYDALRGQVHRAANHQRAGKPVPTDTEQQIRQLRRELLSSRERLAAIDAREQNIRNEYDSWRARYRYLTGSSESG